METMPGKATFLHAYEYCRRKAAIVPGALQNFAIQLCTKNGLQTCKAEAL